MSSCNSQVADRWMRYSTVLESTFEHVFISAPKPHISLTNNLEAITGPVLFSNGKRHDGTPILGKVVLATGHDPVGVRGRLVQLFEAGLFQFLRRGGHDVIRVGTGVEIRTALFRQGEVVGDRREGGHGDARGGLGGEGQGSWGEGDNDRQQTDAETATMKAGDGGGDDGGGGRCRCHGCAPPARKWLHVNHCGGASGKVFDIYEFVIGILPGPARRVAGRG